MTSKDKAISIALSYLNALSRMDKKFDFAETCRDAITDINVCLEKKEICEDERINRMVLRLKCLKIESEAAIKHYTAVIPMYAMYLGEVSAYDDAIRIITMEATDGQRTS